MQMVSTASLFGAVIEEGPQNWQIIQQSNRSADVFLSGKWYFDQATGTEQVFAKIVDENTSRPVIPVTQAQKVGEHGWQVVLKDVPAGGLYRIEVCLNNNEEGMEWSYRGDMRHHIGVGDLFVIAGQSNASGFGRDPVYDEPKLGVHCFRSSGTWDIATHPLADSTNTQSPVNRERINATHSPYLNFAKELQRHLNYPIGLIPTAKGGSSFASWNPEESGELYHNMLLRIRACGGDIRGVLWYQGCGDTEEVKSKTYLDRFTIMVEAVRNELSNSELPFFTIQINRHVDHTAERKDDGWGRVKEAQRQAAKRIPNVYVIPSGDAAVCDVIHNSAASNMVLGERLAKQALKYLYGCYTLCDAPEIGQAKREADAKVRLTFDHVTERLDFRKATPSELPFMIEDEAGVLTIINYVIEKNEIELEIQRPLVGSAFVSYGYGQAPKSQPVSDSASFLPLLAFYQFEIQ